MFPGLGVLVCRVPHINKTDAGLLIHKSTRARHPVLRDTANKKVPASKLVASKLKLIPLERSAIETTDTNTRSAPPSWGRVPPNSSIPSDAALRNERKSNRKSTPGNVFGGTKKFTDMTSRRKKIRETSARTVVARSKGVCPSL
jgi:hypothetical protein